MDTTHQSSVRGTKQIKKYQVPIIKYFIFFCGENDRKGMNFNLNDKLTLKPQFLYYFVLSYIE